MEEKMSSERVGIGDIKGFCQDFCSVAEKAIRNPGQLYVVKDEPVAPSAGRRRGLAIKHTNG